MHTDTLNTHQESFETGTDHGRMAMTGLGAGTKVLTLEGELPVEHLTPGDRIITRDRGAVTLRALDYVDVEADQTLVINTAALDRKSKPRRIVVSSDQPVLLRDWLVKALYGKSSVMTSAWSLIDGNHILPQSGQMAVRLFRLVFDAQHVIYADGLELASAPPQAPDRAATAPACETPWAASPADPRQSAQAQI